MPRPEEDAKEGRNVATGHIFLINSMFPGHAGRHVGFFQNKGGLYNGKLKNK